MSKKDKFSLQRNGETILGNVSLEKIIKFIDKYEFNFFKEATFRTFKPIFDKHQNLKIVYLHQWGTFYKYECAGETYSYPYEGDHDIKDEGILIDLENIFYGDVDSEFIEVWDEEIIEKEWGWPERGGLRLGIKKDSKNELVFFTEDYDAE